MFQNKVGELFLNKAIGGCHYTQYYNTEGDNFLRTSTGSGIENWVKAPTHRTFDGKIVSKCP